MSRPKKGVTFKGNVPAPKKITADAADSTSHLQALELKHRSPAGNAAVQEEGPVSEASLPEAGERNYPVPHYHALVGSLMRLSMIIQRKSRMYCATEHATVTT